MSSATTIPRPVGVAIIAICLMACSVMPIASSLPGLLGWGLWNLQNSARVTCLIVLPIVAVTGILLVPRFGLVSFAGLSCFGYLLWGVAVAIYLTRPAVRRAFQPDIEVINFKNL